MATTKKSNLALLAGLGVGAAILFWPKNKASASPKEPEGPPVDPEEPVDPVRPKKRDAPPFAQIPDVCALAWAKAEANPGTSNAEVADMTYVALYGENAFPIPKSANRGEGWKQFLDAWDAIKKCVDDYRKPKPSVRKAPNYADHAQPKATVNMVTQEVVNKRAFIPGEMTRTTKQMANEAYQDLYPSSAYPIPSSSGSWKPWKEAWNYIHSFVKQLTSGF